MKQLDLKLVHYAKDGDLTNNQRLLYYENNDLSVDNYPAIKAASMNGHTKAVEVLFEKNIYHLDRNNLLDIVGTAGNPSIANIILKYANYDSYAKKQFLNECTLKAAKYGNIPVMKLLIDKGANINKNSLTGTRSRNPFIPKVDTNIDNLSTPVFRSYHHETLEV